MIEVHPNALKHLSLPQVYAAWESVVKSVERVSDCEPPRWLMLGFLPNGVSVEIVAVETVSGWLIIHALAPAQKKFINEISRTERGLL